MVHEKATAMDNNSSHESRVAFLSLREIGRRLRIPPSSVVYYKDRFGPYIPRHNGNGRRTRYPSEALTIFKEIRAMFESNWSAEEIEQSLAGRFGHVGHGAHVSRPVGGGNGHDTVLDGLAGVMDKMSGLLENQALFRAEIDSLRGEIVQLRTERGEVEARYQQRISQLEEEVRALREERAGMLQELLEQMNQAGGPHTAPPKMFLNLPLVIRKDDDQFLGVAGKTRHFSLNEFIRIIEKNGNTRKSIALAWRREPGQWVLTINTYDLETGQKHEHVLQVRQTVTPNHNNVVELTSLCIDDNPVPEPFLLVLLRKIKDGFDE